MGRIFLIPGAGTKYIHKCLCKDKWAEGDFRHKRKHYDPRGRAISQGMPAAIRSWKRQGTDWCSSRFSREIMALPAPWSGSSKTNFNLICGLQDFKRIDFYCFKLPVLWYFVTVIIGNQYSPTVLSVGVTHLPPLSCQSLQLPVRLHSSFY